VIDGPGVWLDPACTTSAHGRLVPRASFTAVQARWKSCSDGPGPVILRARILGPDCNTMVGRLLARRARPVTRRIRAKRSFCGDGVVDVGGGESCDGASQTACPGLCQANCTCAPPVTEVVADATVYSNELNGKHGTNPLLSVSGNPTKQRETFLHVSMRGLGTRSVSRAVLRLQVANIAGADSDQGGTIHRVSDCSWIEKKLTWGTKPASDPAALSSVGAVTLGQVVEFDVTSAITADGDYCFALESASSNVVEYNSREATAGQPQFVVEAR